MLRMPSSRSMTRYGRKSQSPALNATAVQKPAPQMMAKL
jgi:hypothetical protein